MYQLPASCCDNSAPCSNVGYYLLGFDTKFTRFYKGFVLSTNSHVFVFPFHSLPPPPLLFNLNSVHAVFSRSN